MNSGLSAKALEEKAARYEEALRAIRDYPKGWKDRGSIQDFIDEVLR